MQNVFFSFGLQAIGHFGVWWDTLVRYILGMGESQGGVLQRGPNIPLVAPLWSNGGAFGGRLDGWAVGGKVGETICHVPIACICHSTLTYPILGESLVQIWENLLGVLPMGGGTMGWFIGSVLPIGRVGPTHRNYLN